MIHHLSTLFKPGRVGVRAAALLLAVAPLWVIGAAHAQSSDVYIGKKVTPRSVTLSAEALSDRAAPSAFMQTVPEGEAEPAITEPPTRPTPEFDPAAQVFGTLPLGDEADLGDAIDQLSAPIESFPGIVTGSRPPDTVHDVGPNHVVQMVNATLFQVWDKAGVSQVGPLSFGGLWPVADACAGNLGDPIVVYDHLADRWLLSQFARNGAQTQFWMCIAISQTPNPAAGTWFLYTIPVNAFPDYPKFGVWPDGYYMSSFEGGNLGIFVFDRSAMLNGFAAGFFKTTIPTLPTNGSVRSTRILTADLDGPVPAAGTPNYFVRTVDGQQDTGNPVDRVEVYEAAVDWTAATFSFTLVDTLTPVAFNVMGCNRNGQGMRDCIPQPDMDDTVDALSNRPMMQLKYRNFGSHVAMVFNQAIDVSGTIPSMLGIVPANEVAGIRWYELRKPAGNWVIEQQGTYAPQPIGATAENQLLHRWMGSIAMDRDGNMALGFSIVNADSANGQEIYPGIRYTGRTANDAAGLMLQGEQVILNGTVPQGTNGGGVNPQRWGDYAAMTVDPVDDCTFWFTTHVANGVTRIASMIFPSCAETDLEIVKSADPDPATAGGELFYHIGVQNKGPNVATNVEVIDTLPADVTYISDTDSCVQAPVGTLTCNLGDLDAYDSASFTVKVLVDTDAGLTVTNAATVSSDQQDPDESNNETSITTVVESLADLRITKLVEPEGEIQAGDVITYSIFVDNLGPSTARDIVMRDTLLLSGEFENLTVSCLGQPGCAVDTIAPPPPPYAGNGALLEATLPELPPVSPTEDGRFVVVMTARADEATDITNESTVVASTPDPDTSNNQAIAPIAVTALADLELTKIDDVDPVIAGEMLTYTLVVTNNGPSTAVNVLIEDVAPAGVTIDSVSSTAGACNAGVPGDPTQPSTCAFDSLADAASETMTVVVTVLPDTTGLLHNDARVSSDTFDNDNSNDLASETTEVNSEADLVVDKSDSPDAVLAGAPLSYTIDVSNTGSSTAVDVVLTDTLPAEVSFTSASATNGAPCNFVVPDTVSCDLGDLDPGDLITVFIDVTVDPSVPHGTIITNNATVTSPTADADIGDNTDDEATTVNAAADLWIDKIGSFPTGNPSGTILYYMTVYNTPGCTGDDPLLCGNGGPSDALDVMVVDGVPGDPNKIEVEFVSENCAYDLGAHTVTCNEPVVPYGASVEFHFQIRVKGSVGEILNTATVSSATTDPDITNNTDVHKMFSKGGAGDPGGPRGTPPGAMTHDDDVDTSGGTSAEGRTVDDDQHVGQ